MSINNEYIKTIFCDDDAKIIETVDVMIESIYNKFDKKVLSSKSKINFQKALSDFFIESTATTEYIEDGIKDISFEDATLFYHLMLIKYMTESASKELHDETDIVMLKNKLKEFIELLHISLYDGIGILISKYGNLPKFLSDDSDLEESDDLEEN